MEFGKNLGAAASSAGATVAGAVIAGFARKKITFLDTTVGRAILILLGLLLISNSKSQTMKAIGIGVTTNGALSFAKDLGLSGVDGLDGVGDGMGQIVQDENGMVYMVNGVGNDQMLVPYDLPVIAGVGAEPLYYDEPSTFAGVGASDEMAYV